MFVLRRKLTGVFVRYVSKEGFCACGVAVAAKLVLRIKTEFAKDLSRFFGLARGQREAAENTPDLESKICRLSHLLLIEVFRGKAANSK